MTAGRPLRADARRNRARLLEVADTVFAQRGTSVSTEEVARAAGVGIGTVFRHFPTKEALLEAVFAARLRRIVRTIGELEAAEGPGEAFFAFLAHVVEESAAKNALADALAEAGVDVDESVAEVRRELRAAVTRLLGSAQRAGAVRDDVGYPEVMALLVAVSRGAGVPGADPGVRARALTVVMDGLRPRA